MSLIIILEIVVEVNRLTARIWVVYNEVGCSVRGVWLLPKTVRRSRRPPPSVRHGSLYTNRAESQLLTAHVVGMVY